MKRRAVLAVVALVVVLAGVAYLVARLSRPDLVLTGIVTTNDVIVSPLVTGEVSQLLVNEGDTVKRGQLLAVIRPDELRADSSFYGHSAEGAQAQVAQGQAALRYPGAGRRRTRSARPRPRSPRPSRSRPEAEAALENSRLVYERTQQLSRRAASPPPRTSTRHARRTRRRRPTWRPPASRWRRSAPAWRWPAPTRSR